MSALIFFGGIALAAGGVLSLVLLSLPRRWNGRG